MYVLLFPRKLFFLKLQIVENSNFNFVTKKLNFCRGTYSREELGNFEASQPNLQYSDPILFFHCQKYLAEVCAKFCTKSTVHVVTYVTE